MSTKSFAQELRGLVLTLKSEQNINEIKIDNLVAYLEEVVNGPDDITQADLEKYKAELQLWVEQNKLTQSAKLEAFKAIILQGQNALKTALIMNGGSIIALLAFLGKLTDTNPEAMTFFSKPMGIFMYGVFLAGLASGFTYLSQWFGSYNKAWAPKLGFKLNILVIVLGLSSYGLFLWGALCANIAFQSLA